MTLSSPVIETWVQVSAPGHHPGLFGENLCEVTGLGRLVDGRVATMKLEKPVPLGSTFQACLMESEFRLMGTFCKQNNR